jgi:D-3-phosphoglycerate dehydrogenase
LKVLFTDRVWGDATVETQIVEAAGHTLVDANLGRPSAEDVLRLVEAERPDALLVCFAPISAEVFDVADLKIVARTGIGVDNVPVEEARARGVPVTNVPDYCVEEVSDHAVALALALLRHIPDLNTLTQTGAWQPGAARFTRFRHLTAGTIGCGRIGSATAAKFAGLGMRVIGYDPMVRRHEIIEMVDLETLASSADIISLHTPLSEGTRHLVSDGFLSGAKSTAIVVNTARGPLVDTDALVRALDAGRIGGAALDTVEGEPTVPAALTGRDNVILTPHVGFASDQSLDELRRRTAEEVVRALAGELLSHPV